MSVKRCDMCFQDKSALAEVMPGCPAVVCKACRYKIQQVVGFLEYHEISLQYHFPLPELEKTPKSKEKA